jgi:hypothetical protein
MAGARQEALVSGFETQIGCRLPDDYRRFLLAGPLRRSAENPANPYVEVLESLYDLRGGDPDWDLVAQYDDRPGWLPAWFLPVGYAFGVFMGIGLSGPERGRVFQWGPDEDGPTELGASFDDFLARARARAAQWGSQPHG